MSPEANANAKQPLDPRAVIDQVRGKMRQLADEFAAGEINRDQFYKIYAHYQAQINLATGLLDQMNQPTPKALESGETIAIRRQFTALARAAVVYYHATGEILEVIGELDLPISEIIGACADLAARVQQFGSAETVTRQVGQSWLLFTPGAHSTAVMLFSAEPVMGQIAIVQNMHRDFEVANEAALVSGQTRAVQLVYPFLSFVRRSVGKKNE
ncbi:MAG: hypothetical protein IT323_17840 [Anaerolineae bacterium]|nr:hypothetical protein [Anaerolineae bacterium]